MEDNRQEFNEQKDNNKLKDLANDVKRNAVKLAASKIKSVVLSILSSILPLLLKVGIIALVGAVFISAVTYVVELLTASETPKNLYKTLNVENLNELVEIKPDSDRQGYHLEFVQDIDERIEKSIKQFNETIGNRINIEDKDTLKKFIQAEISTQFPDLVGESDGINKFQGAVKIKRLSPTKNIGEHKEVSEIKETILQYVDKETFDGYVVANSEQALKVFTLSEDKQQIVVATWSYVDGALSISGESNTMDYRSVVSQYTMPFEYPLFFLINGKNEDFANGLADLAINSKIDIAVIDNIVTTQIQTNVEVRKDSSNDHKVIENRSSTSFSEDMSSSIKVTNVESWWVKLKNSLTLNSSTSSYTMPAESVEKDLQDGYVQTTITYQYIDSITNQIQIGETTKESNEGGFVNLYNKHKEILKVLQPKWLFTMMDNNDKTKNMVELTKYLLYKATGEDYGVTEMDLAYITIMDETNSVSSSIFGEGYWWPIGSDSIEEKDGIIFASGTPILLKNDISRAGLSNSKYNGYGGTHEYRGGAAVDISSRGQTNIYNVVSIAKGIVIDYGDGNVDGASQSANGGMGNFVQIDYGNGIIVRYMHLAQGSLKVKTGDSVDYGQVIGKVGNSGDSDGAHLHIDMCINGIYVDATEYLDPDNPRPSAGASNLVQFIYKGSSAAYNSDKTKYKMYDDGGGVPTIGSADINYQSHRNKFPDSVRNYIDQKLCSTSGKNNSGKSIDALDIYVDISIVDQIGYQLLEGTINFVEQNVKGLELKQYQKDALVAATYHYGNGGVEIGGFMDAFKRYGASINLWNTWWYKNGFNYYSKTYPGWLAQNEYRYELFITGNYNLPLYGRKYKYYTSSQLSELGY